MTGSKSSDPASARATTVSGDVTNANVDASPSLRFGKLRLYEVTIEFGVPSATSDRDHWPMHGPHALARTVAPAASNTSSRPSRSIVARTCSEPGVMSSGVRTCRPWSAAWRSTDAARLMSSYDELVHDPTSADDTSTGQPSARASSPRSDTGRERSGVCGPLMCGRSVERSISTTWS